MIQLDDQYVLITGSGRGIGGDIAQYLSQKGAKVAITYASSEQKAKETWQNLSGQDHLLLQMDVRSPSSVKKAVEKCMEHWGQLSALINNAGITKDQLLLRMTDEDFDEVLKTNLYGSFYCAREAAKYIIKTKKQNKNTTLRGGIINISSVVGQTGNPGQVNYTASKAALEGMTRTLALELACRNIRVNAIAPGFIQTHMVEKLNESQKQAIIERIPIQRLGTGQDIAHLAAFLLCAEYITGQVIGVNGGLAM